MSISYIKPPFESNIRLKAALELVRRPTSRLAFAVVSTHVPGFSHLMSIMLLTD
jgi:hypothetical protein